MASDFSRIRDNVQRMIDGGAPSSDIDGYLKTESLTPTRFKQMMESPTGGMGEALTGGVKRNVSSIRTGLGSLFGANEAAQAGLERQSKITERPGASLEEVKRKYRDEGLLSAAGEAVSQIPGAIAEQAPFLGEMWAGARAGAMLPVPPQFKPFAALGGAALGPFFSQAGSNVERQAIEQTNQGKPLDVSAAKAYATAVPQAALDVASMEIGLGRLLGVTKKTLGSEAAETLAREKLIPSIIKGTGKTALAEMPTEVAQQMLERAQAGLSLTDKDAMQEYADAAYQAGIMSPIGGLSRRMEVGDANRKVTEDRDAKLATINAERARQANIAAEAQAQYAAASAAQKAIIDAQVKAAPNRPLIDIINEVNGITPSSPITNKKNVEAALAEPSGVRVNDENGNERELTMGELHELRNPELYAPIPEPAKPFEPRSVQDQVNLVTGVNQQGPATTKKNVEAALNELSGVRVVDPETQIEKELTNGELLQHRNPELFAQKVAEAKPFEPVPTQQFVDQVTGVNRAGAPTTKGNVEAASKEPSGVWVTDPETQVERQLTMGEMMQREAEQKAAPAPAVSPLTLDKATLTSLMPTIKSDKAPMMRSWLDKTIDSQEQFDKFSADLAKFGERNKVNETKLKELEDAYKQTTTQRADAESAAAGAGREADRASVSPTGGLGRDTTDAGLSTESESGGLDVTGGPLRESATGAGGESATLTPEAPAEEVPAEVPATPEVAAEAPVKEAPPTVEELKLTNQAMKQVPGSPAQKATIAKLEKVKQAKAAAPVQAPSPLASLVQSTIAAKEKETAEAKQKDAGKKKKGFAKKEVDDRISNKEAINDHIDKTLTAEEENLVAEELGDGDYDVGKEKLVKLVAQSMAGKAISGIKLAIRNLVKKIQAGLMAFAVVMNFNPSVPVIDIGVPVDIQVSAYSQHINTQGKPVSDLAQKVAEHALNKGNGSAFIVVDKPNQMLYAFNKDGVLIDKAVTLTGKAIGDVRDKMGLSPWEVPAAKQVTPAGKFTGKFQLSKDYGSIIAMEETREGNKAVLAVHRVALHNTSQNREGRMASPTVEDNRISQGCVNVPSQFYDSVLAPNFQGESQIYVMPDQSDAVGYFGIQDTVTKTVYDTSGVKPITQEELVKQQVGRKEEGVTPVEEQAPKTSTPPMKEPEVKEDLDKAIEVAKAELGASIRNTFAVAAMAVPEEGGGFANLMKALSNLMFLLIRRGVRSMGQAIKISREAAGTAANKITPEQYKDAYTQAQKRAETAAPLPSTEQALFDQTAEFVPPEVGKEDSMLDMVQNIDVNRITGENLGNFITDARVNVVYSGAGIEDALTKAYEGAVTNALTKEVRADILMSQALSSNKIGAESAMDGKVVFDDNGVAKVVDDANNLNKVFEKLAALSEKIGAEKARHAAQAYLVALRYQSWLAINKEKDKAIAAARAAKRSDLANKIKRQKKIVTEAQEAAIPAGLQFGDVYSEVKDIANIYEASKNNEIDMLEQAGYYSKDLADEYRKTKGYVPLFRVMDDIEDSAPGAKQYFRGFADIGAEKKATGSSRQVDDVFDNMMTRHMWAVNAAIRNRANRAAANQLGMVDANGKLKLTDKPVEGAENSSAPVWIDGERKYVQYSDPKFAVGIQGLEPALGPLMSIFAGASKVLRMGVTMLPPFQLAMMFHDAPRAALNSGVEHPFQLMSKVVSSFAAILKDPNDPFVQEMRRLGITGGYGHTAKEVNAKLRRDLGLEANSLVQKALDKAEVFAAASDMAQRRAIYMQTMQETGNKVLAMHRALDIINFQKHGASAKVRALTQVIPFMNAYLQGMDVLYKAMSGKGITGKEKRQAQVLFMQTAIKLAALSALYAMLVADDDDYKKLDDREKVRSLIIPGTGIKIPVAADVAMLVKTIPELGYQYMVRSGTENPMDSTKLFKGISDSIKDGMLGPNLMPQVVRSGIEVAVNKNFMTGNPIVGRGLENLETSQQFTENTSRLARLIGQTGILSPMNADHLMKGYGGTAASLFLYTTDGLVNQVADVKTPTTPIYKIPSINSFFYSTQGKGQLNDYYDMKDRSDEVAATLNNLKKYGTPEETRAYAEENKAMLSVRNQMNALSNRMKSMREMRKQVVASNLDASAKREKLDEIDTHIADMVSRIGMIRERAGL
jgi:hypothetical protein